MRTPIQGPAHDGDDEANAADNRAWSKVDEVEQRHVRKHECGNHAKHNPNARRQARFSVLLYAYCRNGQIYDDDKPERVDEPDEDRGVHGLLNPMVAPTALWDDVRTSFMAAEGIQRPLYAMALQLAA
jgi:hypothetical protein